MCARNKWGVSGRWCSENGAVEIDFFSAHYVCVRVLHSMLMFLLLPSHTHTHRDTWILSFLCMRVVLYDLNVMCDIRIPSTCRYACNV